jgi:hypothetical protein
MNPVLPFVSVSVPAARSPLLMLARVAVPKPSQKLVARLARVLHTPLTLRCLEDRATRGFRHILTLDSDN